jgi:hypothetical protein
MENITIAPEERESLITEMKRERKPSRRLRMHIALLASDALSPTEIARVLFCSRTTVYAVASRFNGEGRAAFDDRRARGPRPLLGETANERLEKLIEEDFPMDHGAGCARAGAASLSPSNCSGSGWRRRAGRRLAARSIVWSTAGEGRAPSDRIRIPPSRPRRSAKGLKKSAE